MAEKPNTLRGGEMSLPICQECCEKMTHITGIGYVCLETAGGEGRFEQCACGEWLDRENCGWSDGERVCLSCRESLGEDTMEQTARRAYQDAIGNLR